MQLLWLLPQWLLLQGMSRRSGVPDWSNPDS
jgi:hypothetical protein